MLKSILSAGIFLSSVTQAMPNAAFMKSADVSCARKGFVESTFGKEIYDGWKMWDLTYIYEPSPAMLQLLQKASSLGANRVVITKLTPIYLQTRAWTHGDYASHAVNSLSSVTITGVAYACN